MKYQIKINSEDSHLPEVHIEGRRLALVRFGYYFKTKEAELDSGTCRAAVDGYFDDEAHPLVLRSFMIDLHEDTCVEVLEEYEKGIVLGILKELD